MGQLSFCLELCDDVTYERLRLILPDGGLISLDFLSPDDATADNKVLFICPGITGTSASQYIRTLALEGVKKNYRVIVFQGRGIGGIPLKVKYN